MHWQLVGLLTPMQLWQQLQQTCIYRSTLWWCFLWWMLYVVVAQMGQAWQA
jgi:hypothetical protein